jgi:O-antigen ligase
VGLFALLVLLAWPLVPESFFHRFENLNDLMRGTVVLSERVGLSTRGYYNKAGIKIWGAHPVFGVGLGNYGYYYIQPEFNPGIRGSSRLPPHNIYIQALAETGTVGFAVLCWWILQAAFNYWRAEKMAVLDRSEQGLLRASEVLSIVALVFYFSSGSLVYTNFTMVLTMSFLCRRCVETRALASRLSQQPGALVPRQA